MKIKKINYNTKKKNLFRDRLEAFEKIIAEHEKKLAEVMRNPYYQNNK